MSVTVRNVVLEFVQFHGSASADQISENILGGAGLPLATVRSALAQLVEEEVLEYYNGGYRVAS